MHSTHVNVLNEWSSLLLLKLLAANITWLICRFGQLSRDLCDCYRPDAIILLLAKEINYDYDGTLHKLALQRYC